MSAHPGRLGVIDTLGVDRIPGHPASIDALVSLTPDVIASGSEDGMIRVMQIQPTKFRTGLISATKLRSSRSDCIT